MTAVAAVMLPVALLALFAVWRWSRAVNRWADEMDGKR